MSNQKHMEDSIKKLYSQVLSEKKFELLNELYTKEAMAYDGKNTFKGRDEIIKIITERHHDIPNLHYEIKEIVSQGNAAVARWSATGKAESDYADFKKGDLVKYWGISLFHFDEGGKITQNWANNSIYDTETVSCS